ncbi:MAG: hypothetical protein EON54_15110 [Alcaligenaceae bacterium]|nr:MAG: hypothetical protein EON54_15110 [Alcaligenaceae bacterium]
MTHHTPMNAPTQSDLITAQRLPALPSILKALRGLTKMRFAALVRLTGTDWQACVVDDCAGLGIRAGDVWEVDNTLCQKVREINQPVNWPDVSTAPFSRSSSHMASLLGIQAYFAYPIYRADGSFFGTLCAMDTVRGEPAAASVIDAASAFSQILGPQLRAVEPTDHEAHSTTAASIERDVRTVTQTFQSTTQPIPPAGSASPVAGGDVGRADAVSPPSGQPSASLDPVVQGKVLSVMSHDLRNPMHSLMAAIEMIQIKPMEPRLQRLMGMVQGSAVRLSELARQALDFARLQTLGDVVINVSPAHDLGSTVESAVGHVRASYPQRNIVVNITGCPPMNIDPSRVEQLLEIVLTHAVKHCGVDRDVEVHARRVDQALALDVAVPDYILDAALVPHVFDPFYAVDGEAQTAHLGIGLYLARAIALAHQGELTLVTDAGQARFVVTLPLTESSMSEV